jgi:hypothetical protein
VRGQEKNYVENRAPNGYIGTKEEEKWLTL